jgi:class 3 adenylate cyclase
MVGLLSDSAPLEFNAIGEVVNLASRLTAEARGGEIVVCETTARALIDEGCRPPCTHLGRLQFKGMHDRVPVWVIDCKAG